MRFKKRYLLYVIEGQKLDERHAREVVKKAVHAFIGSKGAGEANVKFMGFDENKQCFFLRCSLQSLESVVASLALQTGFNEKPLALRLQKMSGSVKNVWSSV